MSRSGYVDDFDEHWQLALYRGQVASTIRSKRGQAFLRDLAEALDAMPEKRLIRSEFWNGEACALGVLGVKRGIDVIAIEPDDYDRLAGLFGVTHQLIQEIEFENDETFRSFKETPEERWQRMREWISKNLK